LCDADEATDTAAKTWVHAGPAVTLTPSAATNPVRGEFTYRGTATGTDTTTACVDVTGNDVCDPGEPSDTAAKTWVPTTIDLAPEAATNIVGEEHTLTATLTETESGNPCRTPSFSS
jgi:hypothetical protein